MPQRHSMLPPIPADTVRSAEAAFGEANYYLAVGERVVQLLAGIDPGDLNGSGDQPGPIFIRLALSTLFQSVEGLPDRQACDASRTRIDWKYALHLPLDYPGFPHKMLCSFRQHILFDATGLQVLQYVADKLAEAGLLSWRDESGLRAQDIVLMVCGLSRAEELANAMCLALEGLATCCQEWLRANTLPHWYERYGHAFSFPRHSYCVEETGKLARAFGADALYLLGALSRDPQPGLAKSQEVQSLRREVYRHYEPCEGEMRWRSPYCADCGESVYAAQSEHLTR